MESGPGSFWGLMPWWALVAPLAVLGLLAGEAAGLLSGRGAVFLGLAPVLLIAGVFAAVHHAETISVGVGETAGAVFLALAVTAIEVALIATAMLEAPAGGPTIARDTVFAGVMVVLNGVIGVALLVGGARHREQKFQLQGTASALGVLGTLAVIAMILPDYTVGNPGTYSPVQLLFVSVASLILYGTFVFAQAVSQREYFASAGVSPVEHVPVTARATVAAAVLLALSLIGIVILADALAPAVRSVVWRMGLPGEFVAVVIAAIVLLPEGTSAIRAARDDRLQTSLNYALGSAIASTGLTIPAMALFSALLDRPIALGLEPEHVVLLILTLFISTLTLSTGRTTVLQGAVHLVIFVVFLVIAAVP